MATPTRNVRWYRRVQPLSGVSPVALTVMIKPAVDIISAARRMMKTSRLTQKWPNSTEKSNRRSPVATAVEPIDGSGVTGVQVIKLEFGVADKVVVA